MNARLVRIGGSRSELPATRENFPPLVENFPNMVEHWRGRCVEITERKTQGNASPTPEPAPETGMLRI